MPGKNKPDPPVARTVDLSTGKKGRGRKKSAKSPTPLVQETINLSTPKADRIETAFPAAMKNDSASSPEEADTRKPTKLGNRLADLIDPETLAKLRG